MPAGPPPLTFSEWCRHLVQSADDRAMSSNPSPADLLELLRQQQRQINTLTAAALQTHPMAGAKASASSATPPPWWPVTVPVAPLAAMPNTAAMPPPVTAPAAMPPPVTAPAAMPPPYPTAVPVAAVVPPVAAMPPPAVVATAKPQHADTDCPWVPPADIGTPEDDWYNWCRVCNAKVYFKKIGGHHPHPQIRCCNILCPSNAGKVAVAKNMTTSRRNNTDWSSWWNSKPAKNQWHGGWAGHNTGGQWNASATAKPSGNAGAYGASKTSTASQKALPYNAFPKAKARNDQALADQAAADHAAARKSAAERAISLAAARKAAADAAAQQAAADAAAQKQAADAAAKKAQADAKAVAVAEAAKKAAADETARITKV